MMHRRTPSPGRIGPRVTPGSTMADASGLLCSPEGGGMGTDAAVGVDCPDCIWIWGQRLAHPGAPPETASARCDGDHPFPACASDECWHRDPLKEAVGAWLHIRDQMDDNDELIEALDDDSDDFITTDAFRKQKALGKRELLAVEAIRDLMALS